MKILAHKSFVFSLVLLIFITSQQFSIAQTKLIGELTVTKISPEGFVTINGERAVSGRSIVSTSEISTSPQASAKVLLPQTGTILISPNSKIILSFVNSSISGDLSFGEATIETTPDTLLNFLTPDGTIMVSSQNEANIVKIAVENKKTKIQTLTGAVNFNNVLIRAGEFYPQTNNDKKMNKSADSDKSKSFNPVLIIGILGAVAGIAVIALASSNKNNDSIVSPTS